VTLTDADGSQDVFSRTGTGGYPYTYAGVGDTASDGSNLTKDSATQFTYTQADGTKTIWTAKTVGSATLWVPSQVVEPGSNATTTFTTDANGRVTKILGPVPAGVTCTTMVAGCRALTVTYATSTTASGPVSGNPADWGDYIGQVSSIALSVNGNTPVVVAEYAYDTSGHLRSEWDPRLDNSDGTTLATLYTYRDDGRLGQLFPPGENEWDLDYDGFGRVQSVARPDPSGGTATQRIFYDIPVTGTGAPIDLSPTQVAAWAQTDVPVYAAAIFPPSHVPPDTPTAADWQYASFSYLDSNGRLVNGADYGAGAWQIATAEYDANGNTIRTLSAENRNQALTPTANTDPTVAALTASAARAQMLDGQSVYSADGTEQTDTYGPTHQVMLDGGAVVSARSHVHTDYDQGCRAASPIKTTPLCSSLVFELGPDAVPRWPRRRPKITLGWDG
jgi:YD repeat-containing protein